jgi:hypothetical protein
MSAKEIASALGEVLQKHGPDLPANTRIAIFVFMDDGIDVQTGFISSVQEDRLRELLTMLLEKKPIRVVH